MKKTLPIGTYQYANEQAGARKLTNCTAEAATPDSGNQIVLRRMPGISSFAQAGMTIRGGHVFNGVLYVVADQSLFSVSDAGVVTNVGSIPGITPVSIDDNRIDMVIVTNPNAYSFDGTTVSQIVDPVFVGFGGASDVGFLDGFLVFTSPIDRTSFVSGINALTFNGLDFTTIDGGKDDLLGLIIDHREIIYLKKETTEIFYNAKLSPGFPMARSPNGFLEIGCASAKTAAKLGGAVYWLANDGTVRQLSGATTKIISSVGISKFIAGQDVSKATGFAYTYQDKHYYVLSLPTTTLEYDILAQEWHNRSTFQKDAWDVLDVLEAYGGLVALNSETGEIGTMDSTSFSEYGRTQKITWTYQEIKGEGKLIVHDRLELSIGVGVGITSGQGSNPQLALFISDDGGKVFEEFETRSLGEIGDYREEVVFWGLGSAEHRVYTCEITDPVDLITFDTNIEVRVARF